MAISTQTLKQIGSQMETMRDFIRRNPQHATELLGKHPEFYTHIQELVTILRELPAETAVAEGGASH